MRRRDRTFLRCVFFCIATPFFRLSSRSYIGAAHLSLFMPFRSVVVVVVVGGGGGGGEMYLLSALRP